MALKTTQKRTTLMHVRQYDGQQTPTISSKLENEQAHKDFFQYQKISYMYAFTTSIMNHTVLHSILGMGKVHKHITLIHSFVHSFILSTVHN